MTVKTEDIKNYVDKYHYCLCIWTDKTDFLKDKNLQDADKLLEIRCFDENGEFYASRSNVTNEFTAREITDDDFYGKGQYFDEKHFLDIDKTKKLSDGNVKVTGGGSYYLPLESAEKIIVRFFYKFDENGIARKCDWRLVGFVKGGKNNG